MDKPNRVLPLRIVLTDELGNLQTSDNILSPPVLQFTYTAVVSGTASPTELESAGKGDDGNTFSFGNDKWAFNLKTKGLAAGTYEFSAVSGDIEDYVIDPTCTVSVTIN